MDLFDIKIESSFNFLKMIPKIIIRMILTKVLYPHASSDEANEDIHDFWGVYNLLEKLKDDRTVLVE